jgi:hypothetical protein
MFPERSEGDALAGSPPEETQPEAVSASLDAESATPIEDSAAAVIADAESGSASDATEPDAEAATDEVDEDAAADEVAAEADAEEPASEPEPETPEASFVTLAAAEDDHSDDPHHWDGPSVPFVPHHALLEGMMALAFLTFGLIFVSMVPAPLEARANPYLSPEGVMPEWYLMAPFWLLHIVPALPGMLFIGACVGALMFWPFIDRRPRRITRRPFVMGMSFVIIGIILALSIYPYFAE